MKNIDCVMNKITEKYLTFIMILLLNPLQGCEQAKENVPVVLTLNVTNITSTTATSGGNITNEGSSMVTARGVCWNTSTNPTITDSKTTDGTGLGSFISNLSGLNRGTTYYVRAYATNSIGTAFGNELSFSITKLLTIGDSYQGGKVAYILQSGDPGYVAGETHGLIAAQSDQIRGGIQWFNEKNINTGAIGGALGTGNANTNAIVASQGAGSYAAKLCYDLVLGGYSDWYLPSKDELYQLCLNKEAIGGFDLGFWYWSSSEAGGIWTDLACTYKISSGTYPSLEWIQKYFACNVRAIRAF